MYCRTKARYDFSLVILSTAKVKFKLSIGISLLTKFQITCSNWADEDLQRYRSPPDDIYLFRPMLYSIYIESNNEWSLLHSSASAKAPLMHLPVNPNLPIKVEISDKLGAKQSVHITAHVQPYTGKEKEIFESFLGPSGEIMSLLLDNNHKGVLRIQTAIINHLNNKFACTSKFIFTDPQQQRIRAKLMEYMLKINTFIQTPLDIQQSAYSLYEIFHSKKAHYLKDTKV